MGQDPTASDALFILNVAVGVGSCELCICDTDDSGDTTATDALMTLKDAVGAPVALACPSCVLPPLCDLLVLGASSGEPFDLIDIGDVPDANDSVWAVITPMAGDDGIAGVILDDEGTDKLLVPTHPDANVDGGTVDVTVTDGVESCPLGQLQILPLPAAPVDTSTNTLAAFLGLIDTVAGDFGYTGTELGNTPLDLLPPTLIPLALAQIVLDGPLNDNSLAALLAGTAPDAADGLDIDLLNRALAKIDLQGALDELLMNRLPLVPGGFNILGAGQGAVASRDAGIGDAVTNNGVCGSLGQIDIDIDNAEDLATLMQEGLAATSSQSSLGNKVINDALSMILTVIGLASTPVGASGGALLFAWNKYEEMVGNLYPSSLTQIEFDIESNGRIPEDRMDGGDGGTPPFPEWSNARLWATNRGMDLTQTSVESLLAAANFVPVPGGLSAELIKAGSLEGANQALDDLGLEDCWSIDPTTWGPIGEADDEEYVEPIYFGDSIQMREFQSFEPVALGSTELRLRSTDAFTGASVHANKNVEVVTKRVTIVPDEKAVKPGDPVELVATVNDSYRPEALEWEYPAFVVNPMEDPPSGNMHTLRFDSPDDRMKFPFNVKATSTSMKLDPQTPEREAEAEIKADAGVMITPPGGCLGNDDPTEFTAVVTGLAESEDDSVTWNYSGAGSLVPGADNKAVYTAPMNGEGEVTITATLNLDNEVMDEVLVAYGPCKVNLDLGWYAGSINDDPNTDPDIDEMKSAYFSGPLFPDDDDLLTPPANWWDGESQVVTSSINSTELRQVFDDMGMMHELALPASSDVNALLTSSAGGRGTMTATWNTSATCTPVPNSPGRVECGNSSQQFEWTPAVWIDIDEAGTYDARFELSCDGGGPNGLFAVGASTGLSRHVGGKAKGSFVNGGVGAPNYINALNPFNAPTPPPAPFIISARNFVCEPGDDIVAEATWTINGPTNPPERDIVVLSILVSSYFISPVDPFTVIDDPPPGTYAQTGTISASVSVTRTGP